MDKNPEKIDLTADEMIELIAQLELESEPVVYVMDPHKFIEIQELVKACWHLTHSRSYADNDLAEGEIREALELFPDWMKDPDWSGDDDSIPESGEPSG